MPLSNAHLPTPTKGPEERQREMLAAGTPSRARRGKSIAKRRPPLKAPLVASPRRATPHPPVTSPEGESPASPQGQQLRNTAPTVSSGLIRPVQGPEVVEARRSSPKKRNDPVGDDWAMAPETGTVQARRLPRAVAPKTNIQMPDPSASGMNRKPPEVMVDFPLPPEAEDPFEGKPRTYRAAVESVVAISVRLWPETAINQRNDFCYWGMTAVKELYQPDQPVIHSRIIGRIFGKMCNDREIAFPRWTKVTAESMALLDQQILRNLGSSTIADSTVGLILCDQSLQGPPQADGVFTVWLWQVIMVSIVEVFAAVGKP